MGVFFRQGILDYLSKLEVCRGIMSFKRLVKNFKGRRGDFWVGIFAAAVHAAIVGAFIFNLAHSARGHWQSRWLVCHFIDWPVSLLLKYVILPIVPDLSMGGGFSAYPLGEVRDFLVPGFFYLVLGSLWYFYLPGLLVRVSGRISTVLYCRVAAIFLMVSCVISSWFGILVWSDASRLYLSPFFNGSLCVVWVIVFIFLYFANSRKKVTLWLLFLVPFVFYNLCYDVYFYMSYTGQWGF